MATAPPTTVTTTGCPTKVCRGDGGGLLFPLFKEAENDWPDGLRIVLYMVGLFWTFMGVALVADVFMGAIEKVTSKKRLIWNEETRSWRTYYVWNATIANLTLMALGSSAPEILLGIIEICMSNEFYAGDLGPSTIVGSAAFNLFVISAVCVISIPDGDVRHIKDMGVFAITAVTSVLAYLWLWFIVSISSEDVIELWESVVTFLFFPLLVILAFAADKGYCSRKAQEGDNTSLPDLAALCDMSPDQVAKMEKQLQDEHDGALSGAQIAKLVASRAPKSRAHYRVDAVRGMTGGRRVRLGRMFSGVANAVCVNKIVPTAQEDSKRKLTLAFDSPKYVVMESVGTFQVGVELIDEGAGREPFKRNSAVTVEYASRDGTAKSPEDYIAVSGVLEFPPGVSKKHISLTILNDDAMEDDEEFHVDLQWPKIKNDDGSFEVALPVPSAVVMILDDDNPGTLSFEAERMSVTEGEKEAFVDVTVNRKGGCKGNVAVKFETMNDTAIGGKDFEILDGTLEFSNGQASATIRVKIICQGRYESSEVFQVVIYEATNGAAFEKSTDGGSESCICSISIEPSSAYKGKIDDLVAQLHLNYDKIQAGHTTYKAQFRDALFPGGDGPVDYVMHVLTIFWKVLFATIPPTDYCDGWLCFFCALIMIGLVTTLISDLASLLGCVMGLPDTITAITFVALGTSLPDTFASKAAAVQDEHADASIGNVTGSNSVNVFLGIGLSWMAGSFYWASKDSDAEWTRKYPDISAREGRPVFVVIGGDLGKSVIVFCTCAIVCLGTLVLRRRLFGGELGGPAVPKWATAVFFCVLWFIYIGMSSYFSIKSLEDAKCK